MVSEDALARLYQSQKRTPPQIQKLHHRKVELQSLYFHLHPKKHPMSPPVEQEAQVVVRMETQSHHQSLLQVQVAAREIQNLHQNRLVAVKAAVLVGVAGKGRRLVLQAESEPGWKMDQTLCL